MILPPSLAILIGAFGLGGTAFVAMGFMLRDREDIDDLRNSTIGATGETRVARALDRAAIPAVNDITIRYDGITHQIDHVAAAGDALWVIETKNWTGAVTLRGSLAFVARKGGRTYRTANPLSQNQTHCRVISGTTGQQTISIVTSTGYLKLTDGPHPQIMSLDATIAALRGAGHPSPEILTGLDILHSLQTAPDQPKLRARHIKMMRQRTSASHKFFRFSALLFCGVAFGLYQVLTHQNLGGL